MDGKTKRAFDCSGTGTKEGKGGKNHIADTPDSADTDRHFVPLLVDSNHGARILGISLSHFYKFMRQNKAVSPIMLGSLFMWRKKDLLRFIGKSGDPQSVKDILIDTQEIAILCSISRSMVYKLNEQRAMPQPLMDGRTLRWSYEAIVEWIDEGCPPRRKQIRKKRR